MKTVAFEKAQATLEDLLRQVADGEEFIVTPDGKPKAKLCAIPITDRKNGILVRHARQAISSKDAAHALGEK